MRGEGDGSDCFRAEAFEPGFSTATKQDKLLHLSGLKFSHMKNGGLILASKKVVMIKQHNVCKTHVLAHSNEVMPTLFLLLLLLWGGGFAAGSVGPVL